MLRALQERFRRRPTGVAADLRVRANLSIAQDRLTVHIHRGRRTLLDLDGRPTGIDDLGRTALDVPLTHLQRSGLAVPQLRAALESFRGKTLTGRLYLLDGEIEYLELESRDGSLLSWSARPGWCDASS